MSGLWLILVILLYWLWTVWMQIKAQPLIDEIRKFPELYQKAGRPSDSYFFGSFIMLNYSFAYFLFKNKTAPEPLSHVGDYVHIRTWAVRLLCADILRGLIIISALFIHKFMLR